MNGTRHFAFCGTPGSLHKVVADVTWSSLRVGKDGSSGHIDFDAGHFNDLHQNTLPEFFDLAAAIARLTEAFAKMDQQSVICTGYPTVRIRCISTYSADVSPDLASQCIRSIDIPEPSILFVVDAKDEILRSRVSASRRDANMSILDCMVRYYRELGGDNVVRLHTNEGPREAADAAVSAIRKVLNP